MSATGRYLYAITQGMDPAVVEGRNALGDAPLRLIDHEGLQGVVSDVPLDEYDEEALRRNLEDLGWVEKVARTHDEVVRLVAATTTVVPLRLVTIFRDDTGVVSALGEWHDEIAATLSRVRGRREWSVKGYVRPTDPMPAHDQTRAPSEAGSGAAYLARKRALAQDRQRADLEASELAEALHIGLAGHAVAARVLPAQDPQLTGRTERMILNGAYLVADDEESSFLAGIEQVRSRYPTVELDVAGPWAPYSFATLEASRDQ